jgi:hypothetical protein
MSKIMRQIYAEARAAREAAEPKPSMRYSSLQGDPGYDAFVKRRAETGKVPIVYLNDERIERAVTADEGEGLVIVLEYPYRFVGNGELAQIEHRGNVRIQWE